MFRAKARLCLGDSGSNFWDLLGWVWSHSYLTCGEVLDLLPSKRPWGHCVVQLIVFWWFADLGPHIENFYCTAVVCLAVATCTLPICRLCFGTVNALWPFAFHFVPVPKHIQQWYNGQPMLLSQQISAELCLSRCYSHMAHLQCKEGLMLGLLSEKKKTAPYESVKLKRCRQFSTRSPHFNTALCYSPVSATPHSLKPSLNVKQFSQEVIRFVVQCFGCLMIYFVSSPKVSFMP